MSWVGGWGGGAAIKAPRGVPVAVETPRVPEPSGGHVLAFQDVTIRGNRVKATWDLCVLFFNTTCGLAFPTSVN